MKFSDKEKQEIARAYLDGSGGPELAKRFGCGATVVYRVLDEVGIPRQRHNKVRAHTEVILSMYSAGHSFDAICHAIGSQDHRAIRAVLKAHGVHRPGHRKGESHPAWKGGRHEDTDGYIMVYLQDDDPMASMRHQNNRVLEHRLVMARHLGRPLRSTETVHHINGDKHDNELTNLELRQGQHGTGVRFVCLDCGSCNVEAQELLTLHGV